MDRETLINAIDEGPVRVFMNDGSSFDILDAKSVLVDSTVAYVLNRAEDGKLRAKWLSLVCMVRVERLETAA